MNGRRDILGRIAAALAAPAALQADVPVEQSFYPATVGEPDRAMQSLWRTAEARHALSLYESNFRTGRISGHPIDADLMAMKSAAPWWRARIQYTRNMRKENRIRILLGLDPEDDPLTLLRKLTSA